MPHELPTSNSIPVSPPQNLITAQSNTTSVSTTNTLVINKETVFTSVCESILSNSQTNHLPKTIDLVVVSSHTSSSTISGPTTTTACQYKLSEIVSREKAVLFQTEDDPDVELDMELEPARHDVYSVRRRNRQFFTVTEEEENDSEIDSQVTKNDAVGEKEKMIEVQPIFNLGDSLKKLYFPHKHRTQEKRKRKDRANKKSNIDTNTQQMRGYESDPEGKIGLCDIIRNHPELKEYKSFPELNWSENMLPSADDTLAVRQTKSLPNTPRVSPKLMRRNSLKNNQGELQKTGPGFSFLASVAGELHKKKQEHDKKLEKGVVKVNPENMIAGPRPVEKLQVTAQPQTVTSVSHSEPSTDIPIHHVHDFSDSTGADLDSHKPAFISSFMKWGTKKKINVTNKESNMFSPTSF